MHDQDRKNQQSKNPSDPQAATNAGARTSGSRDHTPPGIQDRTPPAEGGEDEPKETQPGGKDAPPDA